MDVEVCDGVVMCLWDVCERIVICIWLFVWFWFCVEIMCVCGVWCVLCGVKWMIDWCWCVLLFNVVNRVLGVMKILKLLLCSEDLKRWRTRRRSWRANTKRLMMLWWWKRLGRILKRRWWKSKRWMCGWCMLDRLIMCWCWRIWWTRSRARGRWIAL